MATPSRYCPTCRDSIVGLEELSACPDCGATLLELAHEPTVDMPAGAWTPPAPAPGATPPAPAPGADPLIGRCLDRYSFERFLGHGGMARVYLARHLELDRPCAIKVLAGSARRSAATFLQEARAAAALVHPHVVTIHTVGRLGDRRFIEMEYVDGDSLSLLVASAAPLTPLEATRILLEVSSALSAAHERGIVHRDVKPANIMLSRAGQAKLGDFGLAKRLHTRRRAESVGTLCGTPRFIAPELFQGQPAGFRSDVYAAGVTYYNLLTRHYPVKGRSVEALIRNHRSTAEPAWPAACRHLPQPVSAILERCLARKSRERFADAGELHAALRAAFGSLRSLESLLAEALHGVDAECLGENDDHWRVRLALGDGRSQVVHVAFSPGTELGETIVRIFSICGPSRPDYFRRALDLNARLPFGAIGVEEVAGQPCFVMATAFPRSTCDAEEVRRSVLEIGSHADQVERLLTGEDYH